MLRRRRRNHEIPFSFDSFLDIVANVVGIIIRLILVVWVGARSYSSITEQKPPEPSPPDAVAVTDPLEREIEQQRQELARLQHELLTHLRQVGVAEEERQQTERALTAVTQLGQELGQELATWQRDATQRDQTLRTAALSLDELRKHREKLQAELREIKQAPASGKTLRYRTPVSQPVHAEQLMFELRQGRITFVDVTALLAEVRLGLEEKGRQLRTSPQVQGLVGPIGSFRLHYTLERDRGALDSLEGTTETSFRYGLTEWRVEPIMGTRGELIDRALAAGSAFRQLVDAVDPRQAVVTIWVYPDSFAAYRRLRDYLHDRDVVVAGRPLPEGAPIAASQRGSASRGQ